MGEVTSQFGCRVTEDRAAHFFTRLDTETGKVTVSWRLDDGTQGGGGVPFEDAFREARRHALGQGAVESDPERPVVSRVAFEEVMETVWTEIRYQNALARRTKDEAKDVPGFLTLGRVLSRRAEDAWYGSAGPVQAANDGLRKLAATYLRGMVYVGHRKRAEHEIEEARFKTGD